MTSEIETAIVLFWWETIGASKSIIVIRRISGKVRQISEDLVRFEEVPKKYLKLKS